MIRARIFFMLMFPLFIMIFQSCNRNRDYLITIRTNYGDIKLILYDQTPMHKENFIKLAKSGFYDSLLFHRVIDDFMIQTGDPNTRNLNERYTFGRGGPGYNIPAEISPNLIHEKGALAAARMGDNVNPKKESSGSQFYIVEGMVYTEKSLRDSRVNHAELYRYFGNLIQRRGYQDLNRQAIQLQMDNRIDELQNLMLSYKDVIEKEYDVELDLPLSQHQIDVYTSIGGVPHLDGGYTVFGKVVEGIEVVEKIAAVETNVSDQPVQDVIMTVKLNKMNRQKLEKEYNFEYPSF